MKRNPIVKILAIETSCDETAASIVEATNYKSQVKGLTILSNIISSQATLHAKYGGVYPELASREHIKNVLPVINEAMIQAKTTMDRIDYLAITTGPGLIGSLLPGVNSAKTLSYIFNKPIYSVNHIEGHIYANFIRAISNSQFLISNQIPNSNVLKLNHLKFNKNLKFKIKNCLPQFPLLALVVSGGHTSLVLMKDHLKYKIIGETLDDAAGEAFDKVAKMLGLGYPGGPIISAYAEKFPISNFQFPNKIELPRPMINSGDFDFSFSGLKTAVLYAVKKLPQPLTLKVKQAICQEFQNAVSDILVAKTIAAAKKYKVKSILLGGGVSANQKLRDEFANKLQATSYPPATPKRSDGGRGKLRFFVPEKSLCTDNAAMIGIAAAYKIALGKKPTPWYNINADANAKL